MLDDVLQWARGKTIIVLDQKDVPVAARVRAVERNKAESYVILIVYSFKDARLCYDMNEDIMMEVMIPSREKFQEFDETGVSWSNIVAFVGHAPPQDHELLQMIHEKGSCCIAGTSRNLDRDFIANQTSDVSAIEKEYSSLLNRGVDIIETDLPREVGTLMYDEMTVPASKSRFFHGP